MDSLLKLRICEKNRLPYSEDENHTYYDPRCIKGMYSCIDVCGQRCQERCQDGSHSAECGRGKLPGDFMSCPSREEHTASLEYISYGLVEDLHIKEGKKTYKLKVMFPLKNSTPNFSLTLNLMQSTRWLPGFLII